MKKPSRPLAFAALVLTCVLLPAGSFFHEHDERDATGGDHHNCVNCCIAHCAAIDTRVAPTTASTPELTALAAARTHFGIGPRTALDIRPTRGPPA